MYRLVSSHRMNPSRGNPAKCQWLRSPARAGDCHRLTVTVSHRRDFRQWLTVTVGGTNTTVNSRCTALYSCILAWQARLVVLVKNLKILVPVWCSCTICFRADVGQSRVFRCSCNLTSTWSYYSESTTTSYSCTAASGRRWSDLSMEGNPVDYLHRQIGPLV